MPRDGRRSNLLEAFLIGNRRNMGRRQYFVYIMTNLANNTLYAGVTNDLRRRVYEHKEKMVEGFTKRYNTVKLVYYEVYDSVEDAIRREKQIKGGSRQKKLDLIESMNHGWWDLYEEM